MRVTRKSINKILVFFATYNEADNIESLLRCTFENLPGQELLVVDDNSPDGTGEKLNKFAQTNTVEYIDELFKLTSFILRIIQKSPFVVSKSGTKSILNKIKENTGLMTNKWFGADAVTMSWENLDKYCETMKEMKYAVTEKADGDRYMMYVSFETPTVWEAIS